MKNAVIYVHGKGGNTKSKRVQEKCGFRYHHTKENVPCALEGVFHTEHITCLSKAEWISFKLILICRSEPM